MRVRYEKLSELGKGTTATVWKARDRVSGRQVALKQLRAEYADVDKAKERFWREAKALMTVEHRHIISVYDYSRGEDDEAPFIVLELLEGRSMQKLVAERAALPAPIAATWFADVASALAAAHDANLLHRDLSLGNLFIDEQARVVVTDFGLVAASHDAQSDKTFVTRGTKVVGTPLYLAPEILKENKYSPASDVYALGVALRYVLLGKAPFAATEIDKLLASVLGQDFLPLPASVPKPMLQIVTALTAADPRARPALAEVEQGLRAIAHSSDQVLEWMEGAKRTDRVSQTRILLQSALDAGDTAGIVSLESGGRFTIDEKIAEGGMGAVYRGFDHQANREVAIKVVLERELLADRGRLRFHREARALGRLDHPNIVRLLGYSGRDAPVLFHALELLTGATLEQLAQVTALPETIALAIAAQLLDALVHAHAREVVHRDLKPANVFVEDDGRVVLADFGIARGMDASGAQHTLAKGHTKAVGSPKYASPEQVMAPAQVGPWSDLFSLGALVYALVTQKPHIVGDTLAVTIDKLVRGEFEPLPKTLSAPTRAWLTSLRTLDPKQRPGDAKKERERIGAMLAKQGVTDPAQALNDFIHSSGTQLTALTRARNNRTSVVKTAAAIDKTRVRGGSKTAINTARLKKSALNGETARLSDLTGDTVEPPSRQRPWLYAAAGFAIAALGGVAYVMTQTPPPPAPSAVPTPSIAVIVPPPDVTPPPTPLPTPNDVPVVPVPVPPEPNAIPTPPPDPTPTPIKKATGPATVRFVTNVWADVLIDGLPAGSTPRFNTVELPAGPHTLRFQNPSFKPHEDRIVLKAGEKKELQITLQK